MNQRAILHAEPCGAWPMRVAEAPRPAPRAVSPAPSGGGYRPSGGVRLPAGVAAGAIVAGLVVALARLNADSPAPPKVHDLVVLSVALTPPPPPPPRAEPRPTPARAAPERIDATVPIVETPSPAPLAAAVAPPAPPVAAPVAIAPVVAPGPPAPPAPPAVAEGGDLSARMIDAVPPAYPVESRRRHEEGVVVLDLLVSTEGRVADIAVSRSSGSERLDHAALAAVRRWRWAPLIRDGRAVMVRGPVRIPFVLRR